MDRQQFSIDRFLREILTDNRAAVSVIGAFSLSIVLAVAAFSVDINKGLTQRVRNQTVADMAALSAAVAYKAGQDGTLLDPTAKDVAVANGLARTTTVATLLTDYPTAGSKAVRVTVTTTVPVQIGKALGFRSSYAVSAVAYVSLPSAASGVKACFVALATSGNGISTSGGATITTPSCAVAAVASISLDSSNTTASQLVSGTGGITNTWGSITADELKYATSFTNPSWNSSVPAADHRTQTTTSVSDPLSSDSNLTTARALIGTYVSPNAPANPSTPSGTNWTLDYSPGNGTPYKPYWSSSTKTYNIPAGTYAIGTLSIAGGVTVNFQGSSTITISGGVSNGGNRLTFTDGTVNINGGFTTGSTGVTFGNANVSIGSGSVSFAGTNYFGNGNVSINADLSISGGSSITMGAGNHSFNGITVGGGSWLKMGDGDLDVVGGISVGGSSTVAAGAGSYRIGKNSSNDSINLSGSGVMIMGDGEFSAKGNITTAGGSRLVFGRTTNHYINGNLTIAGSVLFGTSRYTINGNFTNGTGGTTWPYTSPVTGLTYGNTLEGVSVSGFDMAGINVTFILNGTVNLAGGAKTKLMASSTTVSGGALADILVDSLTTSATTWGAGAQNVFVGAVHLPNSGITMSGGSTNLSAGQCFMLIAKTISATGGTAAGSACTSIGSAFGGGSSTGTIGLIG